MPRDDNVEVVRQVYDRILAPGKMSDPAVIEFVPALFDPEVVIHQATALLGTTGVFSGYEGLAASGRELLAWAIDPHWIPERIEAAGDKVAAVAIARGTGRQSGAPFEARIGHLFTLRDGRVVRFEVFEDPAAAFRAAGLA
jgi:ketosteroid isomerase-like protein